MLFEQPISNLPFRQWLSEDKENRRLIRVGTAIIILQFIVFKIMYPYPNFMPPDSYSYLEAAHNNKLINMWPIGYSKFLRLFSSFIKADWALVTFQYAALEFTIGYFLFTLRYLLSLENRAFRVLLACSILNPLVPHISNFIGSDTLFAALSLIWFTHLCWILYQPTLKLLIWHSLILTLAFMFRFSALYYPIISIIVITISQAKIKTKLIGIGASVLMLGWFIVRTEIQYHEETGTWQFSAFGGWQIAANALYGYARITPTDSMSIPVRFRPLHSQVNRSLDSIRNLTPRPDAEVAIYYLWDQKSPLKVFLSKKKSENPKAPYFNRWAAMAPLYADYGKYLIIHHPASFIQYYVWPNFIKYYSPPTKFMGFYNLGNRTVDSIAVSWFGWKDNKVYNNFKDKRIEVTEVFPVLLAVINLTFVVSAIGFFILKGFEKRRRFVKQILYLTFIVWISNMIFSVFSAPIELRYQVFPLIITFSFWILFLTYLIQKSKEIIPKQVPLTEELLQEEAIYHSPSGDAAL